MKPLPGTAGRVALGLVFAAAFAACSGSDDPAEPAATSEAPTVASSLPPLTTPPETTTTSTTLLPPVTTGPPLEGRDAEIEALFRAAEDVRGLGFLIPPRVEFLNPAAFATTVTPLVEARHSHPGDEGWDLLFDLVGLPADANVGRSDLISLPSAAWYDATSETLFVVDTADGLNAPARAEIVHEVIHALTDQHYSWSERRSEMGTATDRLRAFDALIEGDATYFQLVYIQTLPPADQDLIAEAIRSNAGSASGPTWLLREVIFPFDAGFEFVADLVDSGGIAAVDRAYVEPPTTSEHILHPERYRRSEADLDVAQSEAELSGYEAAVGSFGEFGLRLLLEGSMSPGMLTQTADGWGADAFQLFTDGTGEVAFALLYLGDTEAHTVEVTQAFIDLAEDVVGISDGERSGGGEVYSRGGRPWFFLDREGSGLLVVVASEASVGRDLQDQLQPPA